MELCLDYSKLKKDALLNYDAVVLLAGHSSVKSCDGNLQGPWKNNVTNFTDLVEKVGYCKPIIYASSASVYGNSLPGQFHSETSVKQFVPVNNYDITKYSLDQQADIFNHSGYNVIGLRFGTVNGWAPVLRTDVMINAMYHSAVTTGKIEVTNKHIGRALLGIEDLCRGIISCIKNPVPGIYNMASFNTTVDEIASTVGNAMSVPVVDNGETPNAYDFGLDCTKFEKTFDFTFTETPATIVESLQNRYTESTIVKRDQYRPY